MPRSKRATTVLPDLKLPIDTQDAPSMPSDKGTTDDYRFSPIKPEQMQSERSSLQQEQRAKLMIRLPATAPMAPTEPSLPLSSSAGPSTLLRAVLVPFFTRAPAAPLSVARSLAKLDDAEPFYRPIVDYAVDWNVAKGRGKTRKIPPAAQKEFVALLRESADFSELWAFTPDERPRVRKLTEAQMAKKPAQDVSTDKSSGDQQPLRFGGAVDPNLPATQRERSEAPEVLLELESGAGEQGIIIDTQASLDADDDAELEAEGVGSDDHQAGAIDSIMAEYAGLEEDFE